MVSNCDDSLGRDLVAMIFSATGAAGLLRCQWFKFDLVEREIYFVFGF